MFTRTRTPTIMDGVVIRWTLVGYDRWAQPGEISASRNGVLISGSWPVLSDPEELATIKATLDEAVEAHRRLRRGDRMEEVDRG